MTHAMPCVTPPRQTCRPRLRHALVGDVLEQDSIVAQHKTVALASKLDGVQVARHTIVSRLRIRETAVGNLLKPALADASVLRAGRTPQQALPMQPVTQLVYYCREPVFQRAMLQVTGTSRWRCSVEESVRTFSRFHVLPPFSVLNRLPLPPHANPRSLFRNLQRRASHPISALTMTGITLIV